MDHSSPDGVSGARRSPDCFSPDDALPPVEAPSAGFIVQLFVVPGVIVTIIVLIWLAFNWLAQMGNDPQSYVDAIQRNNEGRWQAAVNLANALNNEKGPGFQELRRNRKVVQDLSAVLEKEIDGRDMEEKPVTFRMFLCRALGSFEVPDGLPALLKAVSTNRDEKESVVRRSALESIALLAENVRTADPGQPLADPQLNRTLLAAASEEDPLIRSSAAYAMGVVGGEPLLARLRVLVADAHADVRYNAATGLARHGDLAAAETLIEMLDPDEDAGVKIEEAEGRTFKRALIQFNALRAIAALRKANPRIDGRQFVAPINKLLKSEKSDLPSNVKLEAKSVLQSLSGQLNTEAQSSQRRRPVTSVASASQCFKSAFA